MQIVQLHHTENSKVIQTLQEGVLCTEMFVFAGCLKSWRLNMKGTRAVWRVRFRSCCHRNLIWRCSLSTWQLKTSDCRSMLRPLTSSSSMFCGVWWNFVHDLYYWTHGAFSLFLCFLISVRSHRRIRSLWTKACRSIQFVSTFQTLKGFCTLTNLLPGI